jgi:hypothetical protein
MSARREAIVRREMADTTYGGTWHIRENTVTETDVWEVTHEGTVLATLPDWAGNLAMWIADARDDVPQLLALVSQLRAELAEATTKLKIVERLVDEQAEQLAKVTAFCAQRAEYVDNLRDCRAGHDYYRWTGHAEARRQLSQLLGLPVGWPAEDKAAST